MEPKVKYTLVGLFVMVLGAVLLAVVAWLGKGGYGKVYDRYYAYTRESVAGLSVNAAVKYRGVEVGRVKEIILNPDNPEEVRLTLDIAQGTPIKEDTVALLDMQGLTGLAIVDLTGGSRDSPPLVAKPSAEYPVIKTGPSFFVRLDQATNQLITNMTQVTEDLGYVVDEENRAALREILRDMARVMKVVAAQRDELNRGIASASQTMGNLAQLTQSANERIPRILDRLEAGAGVLQDISAEVARAGAAVNAEVARAGAAVNAEVARAGAAVEDILNEARPEIRHFTEETLAEGGILVSELRRLTRTLQQVAAQVEREPGTLIFGRNAIRKGPGE
ncbi:MAG: MCE family protein [Deltaproteobacteria bacterium]|nr:MCE family protein [Deltaproteobacteria bacterium]